MDNFSSTDASGYDKKEVNEFVDYVIKKTEDNIELIKQQKDEIEYLRAELEKSRNTYSRTNDAFIERKMSLAEKEANHILNNAKDNASRIVNDALLRAEKINLQKEAFNKSIRTYKRKLKNTLMEQLDELDDIELL